ncbi:MAG: response regulator [Candidatus Methylomirabilales bacterium]
MESLLTVQEAARYLKLKTITIYRLAQRGKVPAIKVGRSWRFQKEVLNEWLRRKAEGTLRRILVVDDDPGIRETLQRILTTRGYHVFLASDGQQAIDQVNRQGFDLVLLDVILPGENSLEVFKAIRGRDPKTLVVLITGYPDHRQVAEAMELGPVMLMRKPFGIREIENVLQVVFKE